MSDPAGPLERLAQRRGVVASYTDAFGASRTVAPDTLVAILRALGEPMERAGDADRCLEADREGPAEPVAVAWDGHLGRALSARVSAALKGAVQLELEDGGDGTELLLEAPGGRATALPFGAHRLVTGDACLLLVSAPSRAPALAARSWGVFAPTYALVDERLSRTGDLTALEHLGAWAGHLGASYLSTLPLLADYCTLDDPGAVVSPYSPISRMWWNEAFLDLARLGLAEEGRRLLEPAATALPADVASAGAVVDECLARRLEDEHPAAGARRRDYEAFCRERPDVRRYGTFRAAVRAVGTDGRAWPARWRAGDIRPGDDVDERLVELHVCAQWLTDSQLSEVAATTEAAGCALMLDLPIGCRPDGYDTWAFPSSFAEEPAPGDGVTTVGAPPDQFFGSGQDWGFRPLHPIGERAAGYPVVRGALRHLLRHTGALRADHILGFQRLWWIPPGAAAADGAYVRYPVDELMALACLEAWRRGAALVGEDLGTVDPAVRRRMARHAIAGMSVAVFDLEAGPGRRLQPPSGTCALVDTHDTATFAGWVEGDDILLRRTLGLLDADTATAARRRRRRAVTALARRLGHGGADPLAVGELPGQEAVSLHSALLEELGASPAGLVIANLEDLWGERDPQNVPGTVAQHDNFSRRMSHSLAALETSPHLQEPLRRLDAARRRGATGQPAAEASGRGTEAVAVPSPARDGACTGAPAGKLQP